MLLPVANEIAAMQLEPREGEERGVKPRMVPGTSLCMEVEVEGVVTDQ